MKKLFLCLLLCCSVAGFAQSSAYTLKVSMPEKLFKGAKTVDYDVSCLGEKGEIDLGQMHLTSNGDSLMVGEFKGETDGAYSASAIWTGDPHCGFSFLLEPGTINVTMANEEDMSTKITGTPLNDVYMEYQKEINDSHVDGRISMKKEQEIAEKYMKKYSDTPLFGLLFCSQYALMMNDTAEVEHLWALGGEHAKKVKYVLSAYNRVCHNSIANGEPLRDVEIPNATVEGEGKSVKLSDYIGKGKWVFIDYWASWCGGCRAAIPRVKAAYEQVKDKNIMFISIAEWDKRAAALKAQKEENMPWLQLIDEKGKCAEAYMFNSIPRLMLFAPDGTLADKDVDVRKISEIFTSNVK